MNIAFYISGSARRLCQILLDSRSDTVCEAIKFVISDEYEGGEMVRNTCEEKCIPYIFYDYKNEWQGYSRTEKNEKLSDEILKYLKEYKIDYMFLFGHHLLSGEILKSYQNKLICFHPSLLPSYVGLNAIDQAMENKEHIVGNSAFFVDEGMDTGMVIMQSAMHSSNFEGKNYEALLHPIVDMFYAIYRILTENRLMIQDGKVIIQDADYKKVHFYPEI